MKSKILVAAVLSTLSLSALAEVDLVINPIDVAVINAADNSGLVDASVNLDSETISFSQSAEVSIDADVNVVSPSDVTTTVGILASNLGSEIRTNAIGAAVLTNNDITTGANTASLDGELEVYARGLGSLEIELDASLVTLPGVYLENTAYNSADVNASVNIVAMSQVPDTGLGSISMENTRISTSAIGAVVQATNIVSVGAN